MSVRKYSRVWGCASLGIESLPVEIESLIVPGLPRYTVVGLPHGAVRESLDRILAALRSSGIGVPRGAITINLAPADVRKEGTGFDLPVALSLIAAERCPAWKLDIDSVLIAGELSLEGGIRPIRGVLSLVVKAKQEGFSAVIVPAENGAEARLISGITVYPVRSLAEAIAVLEGHPPPASHVEGSSSNGTRPIQKDLDFSEIRGQAFARRALEIACAGGHNVLMIGPPGSGKTMLARRIPTVLPPLTEPESIDVTRIHSAAGMLSGSHLFARRPFRAPHHSISDAGLVGGGNPIRPGEISLAHRGVLFLDEFPEFRRNVRESLRQPLEDGRVSIRRADSSVTFPARFMLIAAMNPCPCGYSGTERPCMCTPGHVIRYRNRISGPLLDRFDLQLEVRPIAASELTNPKHMGESPERVLRRVTDARNIQNDKLKHWPGVECNAEIPAGRLERFARPSKRARSLVLMALKNLNLTPRGYYRVLRVARTIADLDGEADVSVRAVSEALQYRALGL